MTLCRLVLVVSVRHREGVVVVEQVTDRLLVDVDADGRVSVSTWLDGELPGGPVGEPTELVWPLDGDALEDLRWYLEDYLRAPFGVYEDRGSRVEARLPGWGEAIFAAVFGAAGPARDALVRLRARGTATEVVFRSGSARFLGLPWELLRDPGRSTPLALDRVAVTRGLPTQALADTFRVGGGRLRVLMVISRPGGAEDVGYRMIARPLLERLDAVRGGAWTRPRTGTERPSPSRRSSATGQAWLPPTASSACSPSGAAGRTRR